jgi:hypothetical protein
MTHRPSDIGGQGDKYYLKNPNVVTRPRNTELYMNHITPYFGDLLKPVYTGPHHSNQKQSVSVTQYNKYNDPSWHLRYADYNAAPINGRMFQK